MDAVPLHAGQANATNQTNAMPETGHWWEPFISLAIVVSVVLPITCAAVCLAKYIWKRIGTSDPREDSPDEARQHLRDTGLDHFLGSEIVICHYPPIQSIKCTSIDTEST